MAAITRIHRIGTWILVVLLAVMTVGHLVLTVLFYTGVNEQGHGYVLDFQWPAWLITILDAAAGAGFWWALQRGQDDQRRAVVLTAVAAAWLIARMLWSVVVPVIAVVVLVGAIARARS